MAPSMPNGRQRIQADGSPDIPCPSHGGTPGWAASFSFPLPFPKRGTGVGFRFPLLLLALTLAVVLAPMGALAQAATPVIGGEQVRAIADKLQCPVCQGTSVADSQSQVAQDMRSVIRAKLQAGESEQQILKYFEDRYGAAILREPPRTGFYSAVWWVPGLALAVGALAIIGILRRRGSEASPGTGPAAPGEAMSDKELESYRKRVRDMQQGGPP